MALLYFAAADAARSASSAAGFGLRLRYL